MRRSKPFSSVYNVIAYDKEDNALFGRFTHDSRFAKSEIINHQWVAKVEYVMFNNKKYLMQDIYKWS